MFNLTKRRAIIIYYNGRYCEAYIITDSYGMHQSTSTMQFYMLIRIAMMKLKSEFNICARLSELLTQPVRILIRP